MTVKRRQCVGEIACSRYNNTVYDRRRRANTIGRQRERLAIGYDNVIVVYECVGSVTYLGGGANGRLVPPPRDRLG